MTGLDETQRMLRDSVAAFVGRQDSLARLRTLRDREPGFDRATWRTMAEAGWFGLLVPEEQGGLGLGFAELAVVMEELGRGLVPEPVAPAVVLAGGTVAYGDNAELKDTALPEMATGAIIPALAWQEADGVYDPGVVETRAEARNGGTVLTGVKRFVPTAAGADAFIVSARGSDGVALYWVERDASGLQLASDSRVDGGFLGRLTMRDVPVASGKRVASPAIAADVLVRAVDEARLAACAEMVGVMSQALDITLDYVKERVQFGKPVGSFQALQHRLVDVWTQKELARSAVMHAVEVFDRTTDPQARAAAVSAAKARCGDAGLLVTRQGIQLHGGMGYTDEADIGLFLKRALVLSAWLGNAATHRRRFAEMAPED